MQHTVKTRNYTIPLPKLEDVRERAARWGVENQIKSLENIRSAYTAPTPPKLENTISIEACEEHIRNLRTYEEEMRLFLSNEDYSAVHNSMLDDLIIDLIKLESGLYEIPEQFQEKIWFKAWHDKVREGYVSIYVHLVELVNIFK